MELFQGKKTNREVRWLLKKMTSIQKNSLLASLVTLMAIVFTIPFVLEYTLAGPPDAPDKVAVYSPGKITWTSATQSNNSNFATLGIFGDMSGTELPLINPESNGTYRIRFLNNVSGSVTCFMYIYCENPHEVPLKFDVDEVPGMNNIPKSEYPDLGKNITMLHAVEGRVHSKNLKDFTINWEWDTISDEKDGALGIKAGEEDINYTLKVMIVVEDYNRYGPGGSLGSLGSVNVTEDDGTFLRHGKYIYGYTDGTFRPHNKITRAEVAAILSRMIDTTMLSGENCDFADVSESYWATPEIRELARCKVVAGYPDGTFRPESTITRAEFASLCVRLLEKTSKKTFPTTKMYFTDLNSNHWSYEWVSKAVADGIVTGYEDDSFRADESVTRAEAVAITNRMLLRFADKYVISKKAMTGLEFKDVTDSEFWAYYDIYEAAYTHLYYITGNAEKWVNLK